MTASFIYGKYKNEGSSYGAGGLYGIIQVNRRNIYTKYDAEILFNVKFLDWLKLFFGPKYQGYQIESDIFVLSTTNILPLRETIDFHSIGLGLGIGFNVNIVAGLYFISNVSTISLVGRDFSVTSTDFGSQDSVSFGGVASGSFAWYIDKAHLTITAGYKFQYLHYFRVPNSYFLKDRDIFHGPEVGVIYTY